MDTITGATTTTTLNLTGQGWLATSIEAGDVVRHPMTERLVRVTSTVDFGKAVGPGHVGIFGVDVFSGEEVAFTPKPMERVWTVDPVSLG